MLPVSRTDFPLLAAERDRLPLAYLDNAATTQKPLSVIEAISRVYTQQNANVHRGAYELSAIATEAYEAARQNVQHFIGAAQAREIVFTGGATESINLVAHSFLRPRLQAGEEVLVSALEHHANLLPWQAICQEKGATLRIIPVSESGELDQAAFAEMLNPRVKLMALVHVSNSLGTLNPAAEMIALAHAHGIPVLLDAAQSIAHLPIDVQALDCDFLVFSGHKIYGPGGIGVLYGKAEQLEAMPPFLQGGGMIRSVSYESATFAEIPRRFEAGTPKLAGAVGLGAALDYVQGLGMDNIQQHSEALTNYAREQLRQVPGIRFIGTGHPASGIVSFLLDGTHPHDLATVLNEAHIALRAGHHCTQPLMHRLGIPGTVRASFGVYNTFAEIDRLRQGLQAAKTLLT